MQWNRRQASAFVKRSRSRSELLRTSQNGSNRSISFGRDLTEYEYPGITHTRQQQGGRKPSPNPNDQSSSAAADISVGQFQPVLISVSLCVCSRCMRSSFQVFVCYRRLFATA